MNEIPLLHRLQTRLALLILGVIAVLAVATAVQLVRGFGVAGRSAATVTAPLPPAAAPDGARAGAAQADGSPADGSQADGSQADGSQADGSRAGVAQPPAPGGSAPETAAEVRAVVRSTVINLAAIFLFTLVGATVFSRGLLTEPIANLVRGTRELAEGNLGVTLPVTSRSELGLLAQAFNQMSLGLAERTRELVESHEALRDSEARYELAVAGANDGLWDWNVESGAMYYSPRWAGMLGCAQHELEPTLDAWLRLAHPDDAAGLRAALDAHVAGASQAFQHEHRLRHADGGLRWVLARGAALRGDGGRAVRVAGSLTDITDRVRALELLEQRVQERTADLTALLELSNSTALSLDLHPLLDQILERLQAAVGGAGATVYELLPGDQLRRVAGRGDEPTGDDALRQRATALRTLQRGASGGALPLIVRDRLVGVLHIGFGGERGAGPDEDRERLVTAFGNQLAVALENARLYQQAQEQAAFEERQHLARELHDSVSQALYAILLGTHTAQRRLEQQPAQAKDALEYVENLAQAGIKEMRALIFVLRPESLEKEGLVEVLRKQLDAMETRHGLETRFAVDGEPDLPFASKQVLYRVAQEALHNVVKHAHATTVRVSLTRAEGRVCLRVEDDGEGFDAGGDYPGHLGLTSMRERARSLGGRLELTSEPGHGTIVTATVPAGESPPDARDGART